MIPRTEGVGPAASSAPSTQCGEPDQPDPRPECGAGEAESRERREGPEVESGGGCGGRPGHGRHDAGKNSPMFVMISWDNYSILVLHLYSDLTL